jgi:hypothetical protein
MKTTNKKNLFHSTGWTRLCLIAVMLFTSWAGTQAQQEQRYWIFGQGNTPFNLEFNQGSPTTAWSSIAAPPALPSFGVEGTGVVTDPWTGNMLFFTDGESVYGSSPTYPLIGTGLGGHPSSAQPVAMCAMPTCPLDEIFIFSNGSGSGVPPAPYTIGGITYRRYFASTQTFLPNLLSPALALPTTITGFAEGMIVVPSSTTVGEYWLIAHEYNTSTWQIFRVNSSGVTLNQTITEGPVAMGLGNLAYTPVSASNPSLGEIAAIYSTGSGRVFRLQFDAASGLIQANSWVGVNSAVGGSAYDVEWSPNGQILYYSRYTTNNQGVVFQHDIAAANVFIANTSNGYSQGTYPGTLISDPRLFDSSTFPGVNNARTGGLKLGPDGNIYHIQDIGPATFPATPIPGTGSIAVISNPNSLAATYTPNVYNVPTVYCYNFPEFVTLPAWSVAATAGAATICPGDPPILLTSTVVSLGQSFSYQWYNATTNQPIPGATNSTYSASTAGSYYLEVTFGTGCALRSNTIVIADDPNCCWAESDVQYSQVLSNVTFTTPTALPERVFVHSGVTLTVDGTLLDLTNVDFIFGQCAGIEVINGGKIIANNSVFRPCDLERSWKGIRFENQCSGSFNECTFVNAVDALAFVSFAGQSDADITNNLFKNCRTSILVLLSQFNQGITGNTFTVTDDLVMFAESGCLGAGIQNNQHIGILSAASTFDDLVSQNQFVDATLLPDTKEFQGVVLQGGSIELSQNTFSNMFRSVDMLQVTDATIENNTVEITRRKGDLSHQIRVAESEAIYITGNKMTNTVYYDSYSAQRSAIYLENSSYQYVHKNEISGFESAIDLFNVDVSTVGENQIEDGNLFGIYVHEGTNIDLTCNSIRMRLDDATGIQYLQNDDSDHKIRIRNNCIFDTHTGLNLLGLGGRAAMPSVTNNFFYNYSTGVYNQGFTGGIGTSTPFAEAGRNTFNSNSFPQGGFDIFSAISILAVGNSGIVNVNSNVTVQANNLYNSGASCANYILSVKNELTPAENCDNGFTVNTFLRVSANGSSLSDNAIELMLDLDRSARFSTAIAILATLDRNAISTEKAKMIRFLDDNPEWLSASERSRLDFRRALIENDLDAARQALTSPGASAPEMAAWTAMARIVIRLHENGEGPSSLSQIDLQLLRAIDEDGSFAAAQARDLVHAAIGGHDYRFRPLQVFKHDLSAEPGVTLTEDIIQLFPNPADNVLNVRLVATDGSAAQVEIFDVTGRKFIDHQVDFNAGTISLDLSGIPSGMYIVKLSTANGAKLSQKFIRK